MEKERITTKGELKINWFGIIGVVIGFIVVAAIGIYLFFGDQLLFYLSTQTDFFEKPAARSEEEVLSIGYAFGHEHHDPIFFDPITRSHLADIYEGLVKADKDLNIKPSLARTWGLIDPYTWEFIIRKNVTFHDGRPLTAKDVAASIDRAKNGEGSQLKPLLLTIDTINIIDDYTVRIVTTDPDPLLLQKMAVPLIHPAGYTNFEEPLGTGSYKFLSHVGDDMELERNENYWGPQPAFKHVIYKVITDRRERIKALEDGTVDLLVNFPPNVGCSFFDKYKSLEGCSEMDSTNIELKKLPGLEVSFLGFNLNSELFSQLKFRKAILNALDPNVFVDIAFGFAVPSSQFISSGVFGYNPDISKPNYDLSAAKNAVNEIIGDRFERITITFAYPEDLKPVGAYIQEQFRQLGIDVILSPLSAGELQKIIIRGGADMYFLGWRSELGDASDFLQSVAHTQNLDRGYGLFNGMNYSNAKVDQLIEESQKNMNTKSRAQQMQEAMEIIVDEDVIGMPLYESELLYGVSEKIDFSPRIDGYVYPSSIK